jgi:hypothetical protein
MERPIFIIVKEFIKRSNLMFFPIKFTLQEFYEIIPYEI